MRVIKQYKLLFVFLLTVVISIISCQKDDPILLYHTKKPTFDSFSINGALTLINGSIVNDEELQVYSFVSNGSIEAMTADSILPFSVEVIDSENYQTVMFSTNEPGNIVYMGLYDPLRQTITANDTTTALALCMLNPVLIGSNYIQLNQFFSELKTGNSFELMLKNIADNHQNNPNHLFSYEHNSALYGLAFNAAKEAMESLGSTNNPMKNDSDAIPRIEDAAGAAIHFVNPNNVWYGAAIYTLVGDSLKDTANIKTADNQTGFQWGWPPVIDYQEASTIYALGDGFFQIKLNSRFNTNWTETENSPAKAIGTRLNILQGIYSLLNLSIGEEPDDEFESLYEHIELEGHKEILDLRIRQANVPDLTKAFCSLLNDNKISIASWLLHNKPENTGASFISATSGMIQNIVYVYELLGYSDINIPFFHDLLHTRHEITYNLIQENGQITTSSEKKPPMADFEIDPEAGTTDTTFSFDASVSEDSEDSFDDLLFRWDIDGDGTFTGWSSDHNMYHSYSESGTYEVTLEVRNTNNLIGVKKRKLTVTSLSGSATQVKIFQNRRPFNRTAIEDVLNELGYNYSEGQGIWQFQLLSSDEMATVHLDPDKDLVIIANDQDQEFYNHYAENQLKFNTFIADGGGIFWASCNGLTGGGNLSEAGVVLPGAVQSNNHYSPVNKIIMSTMPMMEGLGDDGWLSGSVASYNHFNHIPDGAIVYCVDNQDNPTLIEFNLGKGRVVITGQPVEKQYEENEDIGNMQELLPRILRSFLHLPQ